MKIATFNVNSIRTRAPIVLDWLQKHAPDALCLQETKTQDHDFPALFFATAGYQAVFRGEKSYNGVAILSKTTPTHLHYGFESGRTDDDPTRLIAARIGPVHIVNTYVPQGREIQHAMFQYKLKWFERLREWLDMHYTPKMPVVWVGDLNIAPEAIDIHNAEQQENHVCYHKAARAAFEQVKAWGFVDVFRKHHPEAGQYTFFDYRTVNAVERKMGWRVDHILATKKLAAKCVECHIDLAPRRQTQASDHTVLTAEFDI